MVLLAAVALLQTGQSFYTIEARVGDAAGVYRGRMVSVLGDREGEYAPVRLGIEVEEALKGPKRQRIEFSSSDSSMWYGLAVYRACIAKKTDFLFFFAPPKKGYGGPSWSWLRLGQRLPEGPSYANSDEEGVPTMDLVATTDMTAIIARTREFARRHPEPLPRVKLMIPFSLAGRMGSPGIYNELLLPSSPEIQPLARRLIGSPETFVGAIAALGQSPDVVERRHGEIAQVRVTGIRALVGFKSARNVALLKRCLDDPTFTHVTEPGGGNSRKVYLVRQAAFEVLQAWKVSVPTPPLEEPWPTAL